MWMRLLLMKTLTNLSRRLEEVFTNLDQRVKLSTAKSLQQWIVECVSALAYTLKLAISMVIIVSAIAVVFLYLIIAHMIELSIKAWKDFTNNG